MTTMRLGEFLVAKGLISDDDLESALALQSAVGGLLGLILVRLGSLSESDLLAALSEQLGLQIQLRETMPTTAWVEAFLEDSRTARAWWREHQAIAWKDETEGGVRVICAAVHPTKLSLRSLMEQITDAPIEWRLAARSLIDAALEDVKDADRKAERMGVTDARRLRELAEEAPVIDFVNGVFAEALQRRASDIHVEPFEDKFFVRMRIDGILYTVRTTQRSSFDAVASRIKLLSGMDIGERRLPQDGRQAIRVSGQEVDLRVSSLPSAWGESMVLRLLGKTSRLPELSELGLDPAAGDHLMRLVAQPNGIVLVTGPTGSGKTTTIYRLLAGLNDGVRKIITVEDPIEFDLPGVVQVHVKADIGLTFAAGLRSILRQDPDVIMIGEIRDPETARIALQAALTGHMVISTVHTNSGLAAIARLLDLGVEDYLLADVMRGVVGQRLVRRLCPQCARPSGQSEVAAHLRLIPAHLRANIAATRQAWREPVGCARCGNGYLGRIGIYEIAALGQEATSVIRRRGGEPALMAAARNAGFLTMFEAGVLKAARGQTSLSEIFRVIGAVDPEAEADDRVAHALQATAPSP